MALLKRFYREITGANQFLLLVGGVLAGLYAWQQWQYHGWDRRYLRTSYCDPYLSPMYCSEARFLTEGEDDFSQPAPDSTGRVEAAGDRRDTEPGAWGAGDAGIEGILARIPTHVAVDYVALAEGRRYRGRFRLRRATLDSVYAEADRHPVRYGQFYGYPHDNAGLEYRLGLGPGGLVLVWLVGEQYQVEVGRFQARAVPLVWPQYPLGRPNDMTTTLALPDDSVAVAADAPAAAAAGVRSLAGLRRYINPDERGRMDSVPALTASHWDSLRTRYRYCLRIAAPLQTPEVYLTYLSGEEENADVPPGGYCPPGRSQQGAVPAHAQYTVAGDSFPSKQHSTVFNQREISRAFAEVGRSVAPGESLRLELRPQARTVRVLVSSRRRTIELFGQTTYVGPD